MSVNKVILVGHLGADPEMRRTQDGRPIVNFNLATSEKWRDQATGERKERTEWHRVVVFTEGLAKLCEQYVKKGSQIYLEGKLQTRKWQDQQGQDRYTTEVVLNGFNATINLLDKLPSNRPPAADSPDAYGRTQTRQGSGARSGSGSGSGRNTASDLDDEIPF